MANEEIKAAVKVAESRQRAGDDVVTLSTGYRARIRPVSVSLIDEVQASFKEPEVPIWHNPDKDRDEPNPNDPEYVKALAEVERKRGRAVIDTLLLMGIQLIDGLPEDDGWLEELRMLEKQGYLDLSGIDFDNPREKELLFKRYVACSAEDIALVVDVSGVSEEDIGRSMRSFRGEETG